MTIETVKTIFADALQENASHILAQGVQEFLAVSRKYIMGNRWEMLDTLCISADGILTEARKSGHLTDESFTLLADLTQQTIAVFQFVAHARGDRSSGNFIAAQRQAKRLDTMTGSQLHLFDLTETVQDNGTTPNITLSF